MEIGGKAVVLEMGSHGPSSGAGCAMEWTFVAWLVEKGWNLDEAWELLDDTPECTAWEIALIVQKANDSILDLEERQRLVPFISRLMYAYTPKDEQVYQKMLNSLVERMQDIADQNGLVEVVSINNAVWVATDIIERLMREGDIDGIIDFIDEILTQWEKMLAENGALLDEPELPDKPIEDIEDPFDYYELEPAYGEE